MLDIEGERMLDRERERMLDMEDGLKEWGERVQT